MASLAAMSSTRTRPVIAIDGPAGAGKSTLARAVATELRLPYVNTGVMYRALAARALAVGIDPEDGPALASAAEAIVFALGDGMVPELLVDGRPAGPSLTTPAVESVVSTVARHPAVRSVLRARQRTLGAGGSVMEGRDIGTAVFPDADVKIFLSAAPEVRVGRRQAEREAEEGSVVERDALDHRTNPLEPAPDAHVLDSTRLTRHEVLAEALAIIRSALGDGGSR